MRGATAMQPLFPHYIPVILNVVGELVFHNRAETRVGEILPSRLFTPHGAKTFAALR